MRCPSQADSWNFGRAPQFSRRGGPCVRYTGTISAAVFDDAADTNHDGYLHDQQYAVAPRAGDTAGSASEGRPFYPAYDPIRPATNASRVAFRAWAVDYANGA